MERQKLYDTLKKYWGYTEFRPLQEEIIQSVLEGRDTLGLLPTGGGKSLTFQVPALLNDGIALVVTPIISLMKDQVDNLVKRGIKATYLHSALTFSEMRHAIEKCLYGNCKFLYISPERLKSSSFIDNLRLMKVSMIVVDEAHCISQWGYDFRPSFLEISKIREIFPDTPLLALTASATPEVVADIQTQLRFKKGNRLFSKSFSRHNLSYIVRPTEDKYGQLLKILQTVAGKGIVYVRSRKKARDLTENLLNDGVPATFYHAGLSSEEKNDRQNKWMNNETRIMVATNAFGMGIDKPDVRLVVHADFPSCLEEYYQEAGRAGRDGNHSYVVLLANKRDKSTLKRRLDEAFPPREFIRTVYEMAGNFLNVALGEGENHTYEFNFDLFCKTFKLPAIATFNSLRLLSQAGYIDFQEEIDTMSRIMVLVNKEELYHIHNESPTTEKVLRALLRTYTGLFADYVYIDEALLSYRFDISANEIYESLIKLSKMHILHYVPRKRTPYITYISNRELPKYILIPKSIYEKRKEKLEQRINAMLKYAFTETGCRENIILEYFGENTEVKCGHCDLCRASASIQRSITSINEIQHQILYMISNSPRTLEDITSTLAFDKKVVIRQVRQLLGEGIIKLDGLLLKKNR